MGRTKWNDLSIHVMPVPLCNPPVIPLGQSATMISTSDSSNLRPANLHPTTAPWQMRDSVFKSSPL
jgi:hypothetical protein